MNVVAKIVNKIVVKVENKIITNYEIKNKILTTLILANEEIRPRKYKFIEKSSPEFINKFKIKRD